jgi:hypothetical protein
MDKENRKYIISNIENKIPEELKKMIQDTFMNNKNDYTFDEIAYALHKQVEMCKHYAQIDDVLD